MQHWGKTQNNYGKDANFTLPASEAFVSAMQCNVGWRKEPPSHFPVKSLSDSKAQSHCPTSHFLGDRELYFS